jgi:hypothetical protein
MVSSSSDFLLSAKTGADRPISGRLMYLLSGSHQYNYYDYLYNTATNISNLDFAPQASSTGPVHLYKSTDGMFDTLPFELVETKDLVAEPVSSGSPIQFTGLTGDSEFLYKITASVTSSVTTTMYMRINNDSTGGIYKATTRTNITSAFASTTSPALGGINSTETNLMTIYIHPNKGSGVERPFIIESVNGQDEIIVSGGMWNNTVNEIVSLELIPGATANITGTVTLSKLRI